MRERAKNTLLVLLMLLMLILLGITMLFSVKNGVGDFNSALYSLLHREQMTTGVSASTAAYPEKLALVCQDGVFLAVEEDSYDQLYQQVIPICEEAVGSAGSTVGISKKEYVTLLRQPAIIMEYHSAQPLYLLEAWSGNTESDSSLKVQTVALVRQEDQVTVLLSDAGGNYYRTDSAASAADLTDLCGTERSTNAQLALDDETGTLRPEQILTNQVLTLPVWQVQAPEFAQRGELPQNVQTLLGMNPYLTQVYPDASGSLVYVESHSTLVLTPQGDLNYSSTAGTELRLTAAGGRLRRIQICQAVYDLLSKLWQTTQASGQISLDYLTYSAEDDVCVLRFEVESGGVFLEQAQRSWATVTVRKGMVTELSAMLRSIVQSGSTQLLPEVQAYAALPDQPGRLCIRALPQKDGSFLPTICTVTED